MGERHHRDAMCTSTPARAAARQRWATEIAQAAVAVRVQPSRCRGRELRVRIELDTTCDRGRATLDRHRTTGREQLAHSTGRGGGDGLFEELGATIAGGTGVLQALQGDVELCCAAHVRSVDRDDATRRTVRGTLGYAARGATCYHAGAVRKRIAELKETLHAFVDQSDDLLLVISARDTDMALVHKIVEGVDQEQPADIVLRFAHEAKAAGPYVDSVMANVDAQIEGVNAVRASEGLSAWPKLPPVAADPRQPHDARIKVAMQHVRGLFPKDGDHRIVWCFLPAVISDPVGYASVIGRLLPRDGIQPWMHSQRIIARDDRARASIVPHLHEQKIDNTLVFHADFSTEAMLDALAEEATAPETPEATRMMQILQLAALDFGHKRYVQAVEKYGICYSYFERAQLPSMQALCLAGVGDVQLANRNARDAKARYQQGLALSAPDGVNGLPVTMQLCSKAGDACMVIEHHEEAAGYYDMASQIAGKLLNLEYKCDNMEKVGIARASRNDVAGAVEIWKLAIGICKEGDYFTRWRSILDHSIALYAGVGLVEDKRDAERERAGVDRICKERYR
ncbi:MAG: hypothetical protein IAG13_23200 [Deltaproteobacteria bacterium]|nr:hypothetical protein [Nannocystaceae bacterium]